jgi:hypothetical protein
MVLFQTESLVLGLAFGLLEIVPSDAQRSRDVIEDIAREKGQQYCLRCFLNGAEN